MTRKVAVIGLGTRGGDIAQAFHKVGWAVSGFDPDPGAEGAVDLGKDWSREATISATVQGADWIVLCLPERLELLQMVIQRAQGAARKSATVAVMTTEFNVDAVQGCAIRPEHIVRINEGEEGGYTLDVSSKTDPGLKIEATTTLALLAAQEFTPKDRKAQSSRAESA